MALGLAKDSMINLAELAQQKEMEDDSVLSSEVKLEDGQEGQNSSTLVMHLATHEIKALEENESIEEESKVDQSRTEENVHDEHARSINDEESKLIRDNETFPSVSSPHLASGKNLTEKENRRIADTNEKDGRAGYGGYSGFSTDYHEYQHYGEYPTYEASSLDLHKKQKAPFWYCFFPWFKADEDVQNFGDSESAASLARSLSKEEDELSANSDMLGERLSEKNRQAVLARLRLAQPDDNGNLESKGREIQGSAKEGKGLLTNMEDDSKTLGRKSILRKASTVGGIYNQGFSKDKVSEKSRRSLFPSYETTNKLTKNLKVDFSPMARVLTVKSHKEMDKNEKGELWWQRSDYEEFRKTGRMITKVMLEGGSEIWLAANQSWRLPTSKDKETSTAQHAYTLAEEQAKFQKGDLNAKKNYEDTRDKWWHQFGHSRRGLEHIASIDEGRQRQGNVRTALKAIVDEQRRQKVFRREDPEKLRMVSIQHTSWARDLALAAGASDADAVERNFDDGSRKSREFYLLKFSRSNQMTCNSTQKASVPAFMKPAMTMNVRGNLLDANTVPQIRYRQAQHRRNNSTVGSTSSSSTEKSEPLKTEDSTSTSKMAKQAAGFASGEEIVNMSNVLTGMGAISVAGGS